MKKILPVLFFSVLFLLLGLALPRPAKASGTLYFSPGSGTKYNGQNFTVSLRASGMDNVDGVSAIFTYPTDKLTFVSINSGSSAWGIKAQETSSGGTIEIDRGNVGNLSGDKLVAAITFRPKTNSGTANLTFSGGCALTLAGSNVITGKSNATFTLTDTPPPPVADTTPPVISAIAVTNLSVNTATITWTTNEASDSNVEYGTSKGYFLTASKGDLVTAHSVDLNKTFLEPGTAYHYIVRSKDASGNEAKSTDQTFSTIGYDIKVTINDENGNPLANTEATLHSTAQTATTDQNGLVTFKNVTVGEHVVTVKRDGTEIATTIQVKDAGAKEVKVKDATGKETVVLKTDPQKFAVKIAAANVQLKPTQSLGAIMIIAGIVLFGIVFFIYRRRKAKKNTLVE